MFPALNVGEDGYVGNSDIKFARMVSMDDVFTVVGLKREKKKRRKHLQQVNVLLIMQIVFKMWKHYWLIIQLNLSFIKV